MKTLRMTLLSLTALAFFLIPLEAFANGPVVRVQVIPSVSRIKVSTTLSHRHNHRVKAQRVKKCRKRNTLTMADRWMAKTLAYETSVPKRWLLSDRARGFSWAKIGHRRGISRNLIRTTLAESHRVHYQPRMKKCLTSR